MYREGHSAKGLTGDGPLTEGPDDISLSRKPVPFLGHPQTRKKRGGGGQRHMHGRECTAF